LLEDAGAVGKGIPNWGVELGDDAFKEMAGGGGDGEELIRAKVVREVREGLGTECGSRVPLVTGGVGGGGARRGIETGAGWAW